MPYKVVSHEELTKLDLPDVPVSRDYGASARIYEYESAADPKLPPVPVLVHPAAAHESGSSRVIPFDLSKQLGEQCVRASPNLFAGFVRIDVGDSVETEAAATSQAFYVIRGDGFSVFGNNEKIEWHSGDLFVLPKNDGPITHECVCDSSKFESAALYWVHDGPLLNYLGVAPNQKRFEPTYFSNERLQERVEEIRHESSSASKNRLGVLLGNAATEASTLTLTHVLWSLLNSIAPGTTQRPHRHNSVALDLAVKADPGVYTLMGKDLDATTGEIIDPIRCDWVPGSAFVTPPGWWHSHHNESGTIAWVLPMQDAGLYTFQRTLDIRFVDDELKNHQNNRIRGTAFKVSNKEYDAIKAGAKASFSGKQCSIM